MKNGRRMADEMRREIARYVPTPMLHIDPRGGNTAGEMDVFLGHVGPSEERIVFISTWYHVPRIIWFALWRLSATRFRVVGAKNHAHFKADVLVEFLKMGKAILRPKSSAKVLRAGNFSEGVRLAIELVNAVDERNIFIRGQGGFDTFAESGQHVEGMREAYEELEGAVAQARLEFDEKVADKRNLVLYLEAIGERYAAEMITRMFGL